MRRSRRRIVGIEIRLVGAVAQLLDDRRADVDLGAAPRGSAARAALAGHLAAEQVDDAQRLVAHLGRVGEARALVPRERLVDEGDDLDREVGGDARERGRWRRRGEDERLVVAPALVQALPAHEREQRRADGEQIGAAVDAVGEAHRLLGRHEARRAERGAGARLVAAGLAHAGDAEVEELHHALARDEDVRGLEIAVDDALRVEARQRLEDVGGDAERLDRRHLSVLPLPELLHRLALEQLHDEERLVLLGDVVVLDGDAPGVVDPVGDVAFAEEAIADAGVARELGVQDLERGARAVPVRRRVDARHAADAEQRVEAPLGVDGHPDAGARARLLVSTARLGGRRRRVGHLGDEAARRRHGIR
jgi:hypothetical protein